MAAMADSVELHQSASQGSLEEPVARNLGSMTSESMTHTFPNHSLNLLEQLDLQRHHRAYTDITVRVTSADDSQASTDFRLHKCLLAALSSKFQLLIFSAISRNTDLITVEDVTPTGVAAIINYIYTGALKLDSISAQDVLVAARWLEMSEVVKVVVDFIEKAGPEPQMPPAEAALSLMRMSQGIGLGGTAMAPGQMGPEPLATPLPEPVTTQTINNISSSNFGPSSPTNQATIRLPPIAWVSQGPRFQGGAGLYPNIPIDSASIEDYLKSMETSLAQTSANISPRGGMKNQTFPSPPPVTSSISSSFQSATSPLAVQISESDIPDNKEVTSPIPQEGSTPLPLAILSPDGHTAVHILNTPSATTNVTCGGDIEEENMPGLIKANAKVSRRLSKEEGIMDRGRGARRRTSIKKEKEEKPTAQTPAENKQSVDNPDPDSESPGMASASKEIAIQTSIASYTVRMKKKKVVLKGKRKRGRPRKRKLDETEAVATEESSALGTGMDSSEIKKRPLKKRLKEEAVEEPKPKPRQKAGQQKTPKTVLKKKPGRQKLSTTTSGEKKVHTCPKCSRQFGKRGAVRRHLEMHEKGTMYACHVCGYSYPRASELTQHIRKHAENKWVCTECDDDFTDPRVFKKHMASLHQDPRPFHCQFEGCEFRSSRPSNVDKHGVIHSGVKSFTCPQCGKSFAQPNGLQSHLKSCFQKRNYVCDLCGQRFNYLQSMKCHRLLHTGEKPHECTKCGARFADHRNYKRHKRIHDHGGVPKSSAGRRIRDLASEEAPEEQVPLPQTHQHQPQPLLPPATQQLPQQQLQPQQQQQHLPPPPPPLQPQVLFQNATQMPTERTNVAIVQMNNGIIQQIPASTTQLQPVLPFRNDQINLVSGAPVSISQTLTTALQPPQANRYIEAIINANTGQTQGQSLTQTIVHHIAPMNPAEEQPELVPQMTQPMTTWTHVPFTRSFENL